MTIGRSILNAVSTDVINALPNVPYDKLCNLFLQIKINMGDVLPETNKVINMAIDSYPRFAEIYNLKNVPKTQRLINC